MVSVRANPETHANEYTLDWFNATFQDVAYAASLLQTFFTRAHDAEDAWVEDVPSGDPPSSPEGAA
jgi:hypothetical protein